MKEETQVYKMNRIVDTAREMELDDNHVTDSSRKRIVNSFIHTFRDFEFSMSDFPYDKDFTSQFVWIIYDF